MLLPECRTEREPEPGRRRRIVGNSTGRWANLGAPPRDFERRHSRTARCWKQTNCWRPCSAPGIAKASQQKQVLRCASALRLVAQLRMTILKFEEEGAAAGVRRRALRKPGIRRSSAFRRRALQRKACRAPGSELWISNRLIIRVSSSRACTRFWTCTSFISPPTCRTTL